MNTSEVMVQTSAAVSPRRFIHRAGFIMGPAFIVFSGNGFAESERESAAPVRLAAKFGRIAQVVFSGTLGSLHPEKEEDACKRVEMAGKDMPRKAVINRISEQHGISKVESESVLRTALAAIAEELACRGRFHVAEVGSISVAKRAPRRYFNPRTQSEAVSEGDMSLKINISKQMRERVYKG